MRNYINEKNRCSSEINAGIMRMVAPVVSRSEEIGKSPKFGGEIVVPEAVWFTLLKRFGF